MLIIGLKPSHSYVVLLRWQQSWSRKDYLQRVKDKWVIPVVAHPVFVSLTRKIPTPIHFQDWEVLCENISWIGSCTEISLTENFFVTKFCGNCDIQQSIYNVWCYRLSSQQWLCTVYLIDNCLQLSVSLSSLLPLLLFSISFSFCLVPWPSLWIFLNAPALLLYDSNQYQHTVMTHRPALNKRTQATSYHGTSKFAYVYFSVPFWP